MGLAERDGPEGRVVEDQGVESGAIGIGAASNGVEGRQTAAVITNAGCREYLAGAPTARRAVVVEESGQSRSRKGPVVADRGDRHIGLERGGPAGVDEVEGVAAGRAQPRQLRLDLPALGMPGELQVGPLRAVDRARREVVVGHALDPDVVETGGDEGALVQTADPGHANADALEGEARAQLVLRRQNDGRQ